MYCVPRTARTAFAFTYAASSWDTGTKLNIAAGDANDNQYFGSSVAISGDIALIGAWGNDDNGGNSGAAFAFHKGENWGSPTIRRIEPEGDDAAASQYFGYSVALSGKTAVIGASGTDSFKGAAYVYHYDSGTPAWPQRAKLAVSSGDADNYDYLGTNVAISGQTVASGAFQGDSDSPATDDTGCVYTFGNVLGGQFAQTWTYGETGNHTAITTDGATLSLAHDDDAAGDGGLANEITEVNSSSGDIAHDAAGNMTKVPIVRDGKAVGHRVHTYDAWGRLVKVETDDSTPVTLAVMTYDGLGRRIGKTVTGSGDMNATYKFFYDASTGLGTGGQQIIETRNGSDQVIRHNVWGPTYVDELVQVGVNTDPGTDDDMDDSYVILDDANFNVIGMMNDSHDLIERREYHPYGGRQVFINGPNDSSDYTCKSEIPHPQVVVLGSTPQAYSICDEGHQGLAHDKEIDVFNNRARYTSPTLCRSTGRDPKDYIDGNNLYAYLMDSPGNGLDPTGAARLDHGGNEGDAVYLRYKSGLSYPWEPLNEYKVGYLVKFNDTWFIQGRNEKGTMSWASEYISLKDAEEWAFTRHGEHAYADKWRKFALSRRANTTRKAAQREGERQWNRANRAYKPDNSVIGRMGAIAKELPAGWYETAASGEQLASLVGGLDGMNDTMLKPLAELGLSALYWRNVHIEEGGLGNLFGVKDGDGRLARAYGTGNTIGTTAGHIENTVLMAAGGKALFEGLKNVPAMFNGARNLMAATAGGSQVVVGGARAAVSAKALAGSASIAGLGAYNTGVNAMSTSGKGGSTKPKKGQRPKNGSTDKGTSKSKNYRKKFFDEHPELEGEVVVHHGIEQQATKHGTISEAEIQSAENLRGIPKNVNSDIHLSKIRKLWNRFYRKNPSPTAEQLRRMRARIDKLYGKQFRPPRGE